MNEPIVVGTDGSPYADRAIEWAAAEAARRNRPLHIVHAVQPWIRDLGFSPDPWVSDSLADTGEQILTNAVQAAAKAAPDIAVTTELMLQTPSAALREQSERAYEVVVGHRGLGGFTGLLLGSTSLKLAGKTQVPVIVVRGGGGNGDGRDEVLAGVDLCNDDGSARVLEYAFQAAAIRRAWVRIVLAWPVPTDPPNGAYALSVRQALADVQNRLAEAVAPWRAEFPSVRAIEETPPGQPVEELVKRSDHADLLVVGSHRRCHTPHLGSVSHGVIHHADCAVAVIR